MDPRSWMADAYAGLSADALADVRARFGADYHVTPSVLDLPLAHVDGRCRVYALAPPSSLRTEP